MTFVSLSLITFTVCLAWHRPLLTNFIDTRQTPTLSLIQSVFHVNWQFFFALLCFPHFVSFAQIAFVRTLSLSPSFFSFKSPQTQKTHRETKSFIRIKQTTKTKIQKSTDKERRYICHLQFAIRSLEIPLFVFIYIKISVDFGYKWTIFWVWHCWRSCFNLINLQ